MRPATIRFDDQAIVVTGAGRGIGRALAILLAERGAQVLVCDNGSARDGADSENNTAQIVVQSIRDAGGIAAACTEDLATDVGSKTVVRSCVEKFGRIDGIVHFASPLPRLAPPENAGAEGFRQVMQVNPFAAMTMVRAAWPLMKSQGFGRVVLIPSAAMYGALGNAGYAAAKSAYIGMVRCLALEGQSDNICTNGVLPAAYTRMTENMSPKAFGDWFGETMLPEYVANGVAYLLSESSNVNGELFAMGGGRIARVTLAENEGAMKAAGSIEAVRDAMPTVIADQRYFYPPDLAQRSARVNALFGFEGGLDTSRGYAISGSAISGSAISGSSDEA